MGKYILHGYNGWENISFMVIMDGKIYPSSWLKWIGKYILHGYNGWENISFLVIMDRKIYPSWLKWMGKYILLGYNGWEKFDQEPMPNSKCVEFGGFLSRI